MSIQEIISRNDGHKHYLRVLNRGNLILQKVQRHFFYDNQKVFFPYNDLLGTHPFFRRYYDFPPLKYCNFSDARLCHWINSVPDNKKDVPYIIESNDHPLSVTGKNEPFEVLESFNKAMDTYSDFNCRRILVEGEGMLSLFERYFPQTIISKVEIVRLGAIPQQDIQFRYRKSANSAPVFLCLASDYRRKAVDLLIEAWSESSAIFKSNLILACPNVPYDIRDTLDKKNISLIPKAPLTRLEKQQLYSCADVVLAPLHVDGGANIIEAFEFGLPVITMRSHRSFIRADNGWEVDVPFFFYDKGYGKEWPTFAKFWELVEDAKKNHTFDSTLQSLVDIFDSIIQYPEILSKKGKASYNLANGDFSLNKRNEDLLKLYSRALLDVS